MSDTVHLLWLEGVDFAETLKDTTTLSVIRGSSLTLLDMPQAASDFLSGRHPGYEKVFAGASIALFRGPRSAAEAAADAAALLEHLHGKNAQPDPNGASPPFAHMRFVAGVAADDGTAAGPALAQGRARRAQLAGRLPRLAARSGNLRQCKFSQQRVADTTLTLPADYAARFHDGGQKVPISTSALARWHYGRVARQQFYHRRQSLGALLGDLVVTDNLQDMVALPRRDPDDDYKRYRNGLPPALLGKLAVVYADGNDFTGIRREMGGRPEDLTLFSAAADGVVERGLAAAFGAVAGCAGPHHGHRHAAVFKDTKETDPARDQQIRFETLLYGGDEIAFVAPGWFGLAMAAAFFEAVRGAKLTRTTGEKIEEWPLTFSMGVALVDVKMPIRASYELAEALSDSVKPGPGKDGAPAPAEERRRNRLAIHAFESIEPPGNGLDALRKALFGKERKKRVDDGGKSYTLAHPLLGLDGDAFGASLDALVRLKRDRAVPRSQLFRMLGAAQWPDRNAVGLGCHRALALPAANAAAAELFRTYRAGAGKAGSLEGWAQDLADPGRAAMAAWLMTHLWDYVAPLESLRA